jgi:basic membrane protein A
MRVRALVAIGAALALAVTGCGSDDDSGGDGTKVGLAYDIGGRGDRSFNDSAAAGLDKASSELNIRSQEVSPNKDGTDRTDKLKQLVENGFDPIVAVGFKYATDVQTIAAANPATTFAIVDAVVPGENVASIVFKSEQGSYLVGMAAALKTKTKHVAFIGGVADDLIRTFEAGYRQGVASVDPTIRIDTTYLSTPPDFSGFTSPSGAKVAATGLYDAGADVIYQAAGNSGPGVFQAAVEKRNAGSDVWAIGVDQDQYKTASDAEKKVILTSMIKRVDVGVYDFIKRYTEGDKQGGTQSYGLKENGVGYSTSGGYIDDIKDQLEKAKQEIIDGTITVSPTL